MNRTCGTTIRTQTHFGFATWLSVKCNCPSALRGSSKVFWLGCSCHKGFYTEIAFTAAATAVAAAAAAEQRPKQRQHPQQDEVPRGDGSIRAGRGPHLREGAENKQCLSAESEEVPVAVPVPVPRSVCATSFKCKWALRIRRVCSLLLAVSLF